MVQILLIATLFLIIQAQSESRTVNAKVNRVIMNRNDVIEEKKDVRRCDELPQPILNDILGAAFNSRCVFETFEFKKDITVV